MKRNLAITLTGSLMATPLVAAAQSSGLSLDSAQPAAVGEPGRALLDRALTGTNNRAPAALSNYSVYIVRLADAPAASYAGGVAGLAATSMRATGADKFSLSTPAATAYNAYLDGRHREFGAACDATLGRHVEPLYDYKVAFNGMALALTTEEAAALASVPGVVSVEREKQYQFDTDVGPEWIGAPAVWDDHPPFASSHGEGVVVAILDSGINHDHPAFADVGSDGYDHTNPLGSGNYIPGSYCDVTDPTFCNDKLIGAWDMVQSAADPGAPEDDDGHGSHTAGTVAGNFVTGATINAPTTSFVRNTSGVAPHANIIAYDVCIDSCPGAALVGALDQVVIDAAALPNGIAALNYSISGDGNPWSNAVEQGFFNASVAGIFVSASAGNSGAADTVAHESPWISTVAALTHNRRIDNNLTGLSSNGAALSDVVGAGLTAGFGPAPIVYAGNFPTSNGSQNDTDPAQCLDPFPAGTFNGEIVVCDRGSIARTAKGANVAAGGAGGFVLANVDAQGESIVADAHVIPGVHVGDADGDVLRAWLAANENTVASISGFVTDLSTANGDVMAGFSSRGPANNLDILKPDVGAPGVSVMAPVETPPTGGQGEYAFLSGTSMSSPHNAGAGALLSAVTNWSPYEIKSALMLTAEKPFRVMDSDGVTEADMFDTGAGRIHVPAAQEAGLIMDETPANFIAANPAEGGDPRTLNLASLSNFACYGECSWTRTFKNPTSVTQTFDFEPRSEDGVEITATPDSITVPAGGSATVTFEANMDFTTEGWHFGLAGWLPRNGGPWLSLPMAAQNQFSTLPGVLSVTSNHSLVFSDDTIDVTINVNNGRLAGPITLTNPMPANMDLVAGSITQTINGGSTTSAFGVNAAGDLEWQGELTPAGLSVNPGPAPFGFFPMANIGVAPFGCPSNCDDGAFIVDVPEFVFNGQTYTSVIWSVNGTIEAGTASGLATSFANQNLPDTATPNNIIAPFWTDLDMGTDGDGAEWYTANVTAGPRAFTVFEWNNIPQWGNPTNRFSFQIWIERGSASGIYYAYGPMGTIPGGATVGVENADGTVGTSAYFNGTGTAPAAGAGFQLGEVAGGNATFTFQATPKNCAASDSIVTNEVSVANGGSTHRTKVNMKCRGD